LCENLLPLHFSCPPISQSSSLKQFVVARFAFLALLLLCATAAVAAALFLLPLLLPQSISRSLQVGAAGKAEAEAVRNRDGKLAIF